MLVGELHTQKFHGVNHYNLELICDVIDEAVDLLHQADNAELTARLVVTGCGYHGWRV